ncbi:MAG: zf-HC2 domain-containing protein [Planctomycetaceae bacterium]|nr:zf-HC2 domain-containing protein [Planctomycetaceae bacterium]
MNCSDIRHLIHLDVGNDLNSDQEHSLAEHMERCAECRSYHAGMSQAMGILHLCRDDAANDDSVGESVWPRVQSEIRQRFVQHGSGQRPVARQFNMRVAALCVCSLALAVVTIVQQLPSSHPIDEYGAVRAFSVSNGGGLPAGPNDGVSQTQPVEWASDQPPMMEPSRSNWKQMNLQYPLNMAPVPDSGADATF